MFRTNVDSVAVTNESVVEPDSQETFEAPDMMLIALEHIRDCLRLIY
ncbi:MAG: hypothetical protein ACKVK3_10330 [Acidimicrobiales bacterium]|jgi:hypothetical protein